MIGTEDPLDANLTTAHVSVKFSDYGNNVGGKLEFGQSITKRFTIENTGTGEAHVKMYWENLVNTYIKGSLTYRLLYSESESGEFTEVVSERNVPRSISASSQVLADNLSIPVGKTYYYNLVITLNNLPDVDQTPDIRAKFLSSFFVEDINYTTSHGTLMAVTQNYNDKIWAHNSEIKKIVFEDSLEPKEGSAYTYDISNDQDESVMSYLVPVSEGSSEYIAYIQTAGKTTANVNSSYLFSGFTKLEEIENLSNLDTSKVTNMASMFNGCNSLITLDVSNFDTSQVTNTGSMFNGCSNLTTLNVSNFNTSKVTNMGSMFSGCSNLTTLDISNFDTSKVTNMGLMVYGCSNLTTLDVSNFDTSQVTSMSQMFYNCSNITTLDVSNFDTSQVTTMQSMFYNCSSLTTLDVSNFDTSKVTNMGSMVYGCSSLTTLDVSNFNTSQVANMAAMFFGCSNLTTLDVSGFNTSNVSSMGNMFTNCSSLTTLNVSNFDTSKVTNMSWMFNSCSSLTTLDVSNFDTSQVTDMTYMFNSCSNLTTLDVSNFDTSQVTDMSYMFRNCNKLTTTLTIKGTNCTEYTFMFNNTATASGSKITVNYTSDASSLVDSMIATKSTNSNVVKGVAVS